MGRNKIFKPLSIPEISCLVINLDDTDIKANKTIGYPIRNKLVIMLNKNVLMFNQGLYFELDTSNHKVCNELNYLFISNFTFKPYIYLLGL